MARKKRPAAEAATATTEPPEDDLINLGLAAYGISPEFVIGTSLHGDTATIVTHGGKKVTFSAGDTPEPLTQAEIEGAA